jgi:hypothetical protein
MVAGAENRTLELPNTKQDLYKGLYIIVIVKKVLQGETKMVECILKKPVYATSNFSSLLVCMENYSSPALFGTNMGFDLLE